MSNVAPNTISTLIDQATLEQANDLIYIQSKLNVHKQRKNEFGGFNYRNCEDIVNALKPLLDERGCTLTITDDVVVFGEGDNTRFYIKASATLFDSKGDGKTVQGFAREPLTRKGMDDSQISGSASSYARKYALSGLFLLDDSVDPDEGYDITEAEIAAFMDLVGNEDGVGLYAMQIKEVIKFQNLRRNCAPKGGKTKFINKVNQLILDTVEHSKKIADEILDLLEKGDRMGILQITEDLSRDMKVITWRQIPEDRHPDIAELLK